MMSNDPVMSYQKVEITVPSCEPFHLFIQKTRAVLTHSP
jgi:hypothetical protein